MAISWDKKKEISEKIKSIVESAQTVVFVNFHGLSVTDSNELRKELRGENVGYYVAKKTLIKRELEENVGKDMPELGGEIALAYLPAMSADMPGVQEGERDNLVPARLIHRASSKYKDSIKILGGIFENKYADAAEMIEIALIPDRHTLLRMLVNVINSPIQGLVVALDQIAVGKDR
jgi:large subunit ribosomal protein L10